MVVDDDPTMLRMIELYLADFPVEVKLVRNGRVALRHLEKGHYDLLLTDLQMPELDGISLIKKLRAEQLDLPIIILSAYGMEKMADEAIELGADELLCKPFDSNTLKKKIRNQLNLS
jgi:DNA-binding response OmpR family regulator